MPPRGIQEARGSEHKEQPGSKEPDADGDIPVKRPRTLNRDEPSTNLADQRGEGTGLRRKEAGGKGDIQEIGQRETEVKKEKVIEETG
ncbi:hypothetical protein NDU88_007352 [Pleurodeles waltl]|uniref:Uncharacterized protein n=1 Tax=Pleurodeles waltl TaxID=8319 RepID=A0AAV7PNR4_PLEWA|nr:hypothetical protein NDU88_007352 [Pleurodeles waltl]